MRWSQGLTQWTTWREILSHRTGRRNPNTVSYSSWDEDSCEAWGGKQCLKTDRQNTKEESSPQRVKDPLRFLCKSLDMHWSVPECQETTESGKSVSRKEQLNRSLLLTQEEETLSSHHIKWKDFPANGSLNRDGREWCIVVTSNELQTNGCSITTNQHLKESFERSKYFNVLCTKTIINNIRRNNNKNIPQPLT